MNKSSVGRFFEDFSLGQLIEHPIPRTITEGDASLYIALTGSRFSLYSSHHLARKVGFDRPPVDNLLLFHIAFGKTVQDISLNAVANLGYAEVQFVLPAFIGDTISVLSEVIGLKENSNGKTGIVYVHSRATNQDGHLVASWKRWVMVHKKTEGMQNTYAVEPQLNSEVSPAHLAMPDQFNADNYSYISSGEKFVFRDYQVGEWIDHIDGLTIDATEHTMATKLYQNNAKVHFNYHQMQDSQHQQRLVYGGHIISLCRSLSHNGLANAQWLAAINGGAHLNPSYAGNTIYAATQVQNKYELGFGMGALRLKTIGFKNVQWDSIKEKVSSANNPKQLPENVVLDLDYTVLIPDPK